jgi:hypothetical protein
MKAFKHAPISIDNNTQIVVTGHSAGAALATLVSVSLKRKLGLSQRIHLITFGSPRVGNPKAAAFISSLFGDGGSRSGGASFVRALRGLRDTGASLVTGRGDSASADLYSSDRTIAVSHSYRFTHYRDAVVHTPLTIYGYRHITTELYEDEHGHVRQCSGAEDPQCADQWVILTISDHLHYLGQQMRCPDAAAAHTTEALNTYDNTYAMSQVVVEDSSSSEKKYVLPQKEGDEYRGEASSVALSSTVSRVTGVVGSGGGGGGGTAVVQPSGLRRAGSKVPPLPTEHSSTAAASTAAGVGEGGGGGTAVEGKGRKNARILNAIKREGLGDGVNDLYFMNDLQR